MRRVLFAIMIAFFASLMGSGCAVTKHPLVQALSPKNLPRTLRRSSEVEARIHASAKLPLLPPGSIHVETKGRTTIITIRPPVDPVAFQRVKDEADCGPYRVKVVEQKGDEE